MNDAPLRLTKTVSKGGCAAKLAAGTLRDLLKDLPRPDHPDLLVGHDALDDAAAWRLRDDVAMVQTLDFFTPIVDDPEDFGAVAAANAVSDVFAMGAEPRTALTILAYPIDDLPAAILHGLMRGAGVALAEAGAHLVGGHSIEDDTLKLGFSVTGVAHPRGLWSNDAARPGDALILTKAVGTGTLTGARKNDEIDAATLEEAIASMRQVNRLDLDDALRGAVRAATDVTGFGLLGHALHVAQASGVAIHVDPDAVPLLHGAQETLARGILTKAHVSNTRYVEPHVRGRDALEEATWWRLVDPQTSGGLLLAVEPGAADDLLAAIRPRFPRAARVGTVAAADGGADLVVRAEVAG
ncbi:MAG: selenide, water dikinase SelD [Trueperaceae bacterium]|nr:selenide, water dikinase SelD [Trueperaceae bacterium]